MGKIKISQRLVPWAPWMLAMPRTATSELVSKPSPNMTPSGNIFHGRSTMWNVLRKTLARKPVPSTANGPAAPSAARPSLCALSSSRSLFTRFHSTQLFPAQRISSTVAVTLVPTMFPTRWKLSNRSLSAPDVAATTTHVMITMVKWPRLKKVPTATGR